MEDSLRTFATAFIPVRAGSKGIVGKNMLPVGGRPLVDWVINAAIGSKTIEQVVISTDDDVLSEHVKRNWPAVVIFRRSPETATDTATTESAIREYLEIDTFADPLVLMQATSPLTTSEDVDSVLRDLNNGYDSVVSVVRQLRFQWVDSKSEGATPVGFDPLNRPRRQQHDGFLVENGALYATSRAGFLKTNCRVNGRVGLHEMSEDSYFELDETSDVLIIDQLLRSRIHSQIIPASFTTRIADIRLVITDVDGCLTDNGMYYESSGEETKRFSARDGKGFELLRNHGIATMLLTSETNSMVEQRAAKLQVNHLGMGSTNKIADANSVRLERGLEWNQVAFLGDDVQDIELMKLVGLSVCPSDATPEARSAAIYHCNAQGGYGAFREMADLIIGHLNNH